MRAIWSEGTAAYHGRYVSFRDVVAYPHPVQQPCPPIVVGGRAPAVLRRAVEQANGWYGFALDLDETARLLAQLREAARRYQRPDGLGELEISVAPRVPLEKDTALRFADLGVHRLILIPPARHGCASPATVGKDERREVGGQGLKAVGSMQLIRKRQESVHLQVTAEKPVMAGPQSSCVGGTGSHLLLPRVLQQPLDLSAFFHVQPAEPMLTSFLLRPFHSKRGAIVRMEEHELV